MVGHILVCQNTPDIAFESIFIGLRKVEESSNTMLFISLSQDIIYLLTPRDPMVLKLWHAGQVSPYYTFVVVKRIV